VVHDQQLVNALATLHAVFQNTADADELWRAMRWSEVAAIANVLHAAGYADAGADVLRSWIAAVDLEEELTDTGDESPLDLMARWDAQG
jgi:hypothetical protein